MRKSKNYYKFMEYMAFGISGWHEDAVMVDNGVIECVAYPKVADIEDYSKLYKCNYDKMTMDSDNTWLTIKCVLVNEEVINVYYVTNECNLYIGQLILDDYRTQKQALDAIHKEVVCFFLNSREFCELHPTEEEINEYEEIIEVGEATETTETEDFEGLDKIETSEQETIETNEIKGHLYIDTDSVKIAPLNPTPEICRVCAADRQGNRCGGVEFCTVTRNRYYAMVNPEWHHVTLSTLANLDFDMLDEKRQTYLSAYRDLKQTLSYLRKCKTQDTYDTCFIRYTRRKNMLWAEGKISDAMWKYIERKLSMQNVESGVWASRCEDATGHHESRRYNKSRA